MFIALIGIFRYFRPVKLKGMEFGRLEESELRHIDFTLPGEPASNKIVLTGKPVRNPGVYVGCAKWGREEWVGKIYPSNTRERSFLKHYVEHFNAIELNVTHYKIYGEPGIRRWADKAKNKDFLFCPKMYQGLTHRGTLDGRHPLLNEFFRGIVAFEEHLGPIFVQFNDTFSPKRKQQLFNFLSYFPKDLQFFLEVRHPGWFAKMSEWEDLLSYLRDNNMGAVITDSAGRRDCAHMYLTIPKAFIRFVGNSLHPTDFTRIDDWVKRLKYWLNNGLKELFFFVRMHDEATSPELALYLVDRINKECNLELKKPQFIET